MSLLFILGRYLPWQRLYFLPLLQGHLALRPILPWSGCMVRFSLQKAQVQAAGWSLYQLVLVAMTFLIASVSIGEDAPRTSILQP